MKYRVTHSTRYGYDEAIPLSHNVVRMRPRDDDTQTCLQYQLLVLPPPTVKNEGFDRWVRSQDTEWDLLASLEKALPRIRNDCAHGTYNLAPTALGIIELVHEIINQLFQSSTPKKSC